MTKYEGESNENLKSAMKIRNTARLSRINENLKSATKIRNTARLSRKYQQ